MAYRRQLLHIVSATSPSAASTVVLGSLANGLSGWDWFQIDAQLLGATGGTLDITLQRKLEVLDDQGNAVDFWFDWLRFPQLAAAAPAVSYSAQSGTSNTIFTVGSVVTASPVAPTLAAGTFVGGHPGESIRVIATAGASTSAGAAQKIYITGWRHSEA
jgi:hypothetical protein